jgi:hypothetical protein
LFSKPVREGQQLVVVNQTGTDTCTAVVSLPFLEEELAAIAEKHVKKEWRSL